MNGFIISYLFCGVCPASIAFVKAVNATGGVNQFLFSGKKRVTFRANFDVQIIAHRRACLKTVTARAGNGDVLIIRMYFRFHLFNGLLYLIIADKTQTVIVCVIQMKRQAERFAKAEAVRRM